MTTASPPQMGEKRCSKCHKTKLISEFPKRTAARDGLYSWCKACANKAVSDYKKRNKRTVQNTNWRAHIKRKYDMSERVFQALLVKQGGGCAICGHPPAKGQRLQVDHNHANGAVRSLLCGPCNTGLGRFQDDPARLRSAIQYLERHSDV